MKSTVFLISIYLLFLALLPCGCNIQITDSGENKTVKISVTHHEHGSTEENCTPFCTCSGCHNPHFITRYTLDLGNRNIVSGRTIAFYNENQTTSYLESLWRPPKA